ncbi:sigma factor-like helix-turn-helix DNA-binding protein [Streptomyces sp. V4-01]|uniref:Sigma factor-like helix-turn-helix DNA-binding protein n=1 Tax=Actinacidiphila polyblastidii TaxID=3110430 RepID=A0ABU7PE72_9ACTN|nr:sigma factor-like helix-turn-helix DNA-binding protein [Streptomyces sp. V4-01]
MGRRRAEAELRRDAEFAAFTAGAGGRLLHAATLLTGDPQAAEALLTTVLAHVYADWFRMRAEDPYEQARSELVRRFSYRPWWHRPRGGQLDRLSARERLIVTMRFFEGIAEEQTAAQLGLPLERVNAISARAAATLRSRRPPSAAAAGTSRPPRRTDRGERPEPPDRAERDGGGARRPARGASR